MAEAAAGQAEAQRRRRSAAAVALDDVTIAFRLADGGTYTAVQRASLDVADGEFVAIVGPTGCGKIDAAQCRRRPASRRRPARRRYLRHAARRASTGRPAICFRPKRCFPGRPRSTMSRSGSRPPACRAREARERAQDWLTRVGLGAFGARYPHMLSGGQRKRVGLAQVLIRDPKILLMDEPFGPLDAQTRQIMGNLLLDLWSADRKAVMFVTHDLEEAIALSDRVVIMSAGPAARIIGDWRVPLPRPRDIAEVKLDPAFHAAAPRNLADAEGRSDEGLRADGRRVMNRVTLIALAAPGRGRRDR